MYILTEISNHRALRLTHILVHVSGNRVCLGNRVSELHRQTHGGGQIDGRVLPSIWDIEHLPRALGAFDDHVLEAGVPLFDPLAVHGVTRSA